MRLSVFICIWATNHRVKLSDAFFPRVSVSGVRCQRGIHKNSRIWAIWKNTCIMHLCHESPHIWL